MVSTEGFTERQLALAKNAQRLLEPFLLGVDHFAESLVVVEDVDTALEIIKESREVKELYPMICEFWGRWVLYGRIHELLIDYGSTSRNSPSGHDGAVACYYYVIHRADEPLASRVAEMLSAVGEDYPLAFALSEAIAGKLENKQPAE